MRWGHAVREVAYPTIDRFSRPVGAYAAYRLDSAEYVGSTDLDVAGAIDALHDRGYEPAGVLAALKWHPDVTHRSDDGSYRKVAEQHPPDLDCTLTREWRPSECQYHVHIYGFRDRTEVFSHYELRPDLLAPTVSIERLRTHYRPTYYSSDPEHATYVQGLTSPDVVAGADVLASDQPL